MCRLTVILAATCKHSTRYEYSHCAASPYPKRCPELIDSVSASIIDGKEAFCPPCFKAIRTEMFAAFYAERRMVTSTARAEGCWTNDEISEMRIELRDQFYEKLKYANKPLPALPPTQAHTTVDTMDEILAESKGTEAAGIRIQLKE